MKMFKRYIALLVVFVMAFALLGGCGQDTANQAAATTAAASATPADQAAGTVSENTAVAASTASDAGKVELPLTKEKQTLSYWFGWNPQVDAYMKSFDENPTYQELEKRTNVHIDFTLVPGGQQQEKFNLAVASSDYPEMIIGIGSLYAGGLDKAVSDGVVVKLNDYIDKFAPNYKKIINENDQNRKTVTTDSGNITQFVSYGQNVAGQDNGPVVRKDWLDSLGLKAPVTYEDYYNMLKAFKEKTGGTGPYLMSADINPRYDSLAAGYGVSVQNATRPWLMTPFYQVDGKVKFGYVEEGYKEYITMLAKWYSEGLIYQDYLKNNGPVPLEQPIYNNQVGLWYTDQGLISDYKTKAVDPNFEAVAITDAVKNAGDVTHLGKDLTPMQSMGICITDKCKNVELAVKWNDYLYTEEGSLLANYGVEGTSCKIVDGKPQFTEIITKNPEGMPAKLAVFKYAMEQGGYINDASKYNSIYNPVDMEAAAVWSTNKDYSWNIPSTVSLSADEASEFTNIIMDILTYSSEMTNKFITGKEPMSKFDDFVKQMHTMGIDKCIALEQAAYDRYIAR
ncbi:MAG: extracellular solute-binding protein [Clostridiales bacterium]|nr:extracellular solute-binding protein [Clostridiales bacterium]